MRAKHAPGPWRTSLTDDTVIVDASGREVAAVGGDYNDPDTWPIMEANARLIAAGPDLKGALSLLREACRHATFDNGVTAPDGRNEGDHWASDAIDLAEVALAKTEFPTRSGSDSRNVFPNVPGQIVSALDDIASERRRQIEAKGWDAAHDEEHTNGELAFAAACYAMGSPLQHDGGQLWPWGWKWWKPKDRRRDLVRAGALIIAEIERLDRAARFAACSGS